MSSYNRAKALEYARKYWTRVCSDGYIGIKSAPSYKQVPLGTVFEQKFHNGDWEDEWAKLPNGSKIVWDELEDCTHFISCCLGSPPGETAGGLHIHRDFNTIYGRLGADRLFNDLKADGLIHIVAERKSIAQAGALISQLQAGDLIFYCKDQLPHHHSAIYLADSKHRIACHTYCRCDVDDNYSQAWNDSLGYNNCTLAKVL
ncbi:amidase domain-containing protein [Aquisphaera insulae]|uniref:amidase domain-containing protein n=1 Tax=Aquisphaera insulae TaxID=2712864 RepID=UPI0013EE205B|nr:amidase domain-containing protein [Aquisphaera insulae]